MNELSPNFEHKLLITCGMLAVNFIAIRSAIPVLLWPTVSWLAVGHCKMLLMFRSFFRCLYLGGLWADRHQTLLHVRR